MLVTILIDVTDAIKVHCKGAEEIKVLLPLRPHPHVPVVINLDVNDIRAAADRAILDVFLAGSRCQVDGHDDLLAAGITDVAGFVFHGSFGSVEG